jgi:hypothetical protein
MPLQPCINTAAGRRSPLRAAEAGSKSIPESSTSGPRKLTGCSRIGTCAGFAAAAGFVTAGGFDAQPPAHAARETSSTAQNLEIRPGANFYLLATSLVQRTISSAEAVGVPVWSASGSYSRVSELSGSELNRGIFTLRSPGRSLVPIIHRIGTCGFAARAARPMFMAPSGSNHVR